MSFSKAIRDYRDLEEYGLAVLTREACAVNMRTLFDMNQRGVELIERFLSIKLAGDTPGNWNSKVNGHAAVASVMLADNVIQDLMVYILLAVESYTFVVVTEYGAIGHHDSEMHKLYASGSADCKGVYVNVSTDQPRRGDRNIHAMTGRTV